MLHMGEIAELALRLVRNAGVVIDGSSNTSRMKGKLLNSNGL